MFYLELEGLVTRIAIEIGDAAEHLRTDDRISPEQLSRLLGGLRDSPFMRLAQGGNFSGLAPLNQRRLVQLANEMEKTLWAKWVPSLRRMVPLANPPGARGLPSGGGLPTYDSPGGDVEDRLDTLGVMIPTSPQSRTRQRAGLFFGWDGEWGPLTTDREVQMLILWGRRFLRQRWPTPFQFNDSPMA
jgi:hypothetical protein